MWSYYDLITELIEIPSDCVVCCRSLLTFEVKFDIKLFCMPKTLSLLGVLCYVVLLDLVGEFLQVAALSMVVIYLGVPD